MVGSAAFSSHPSKLGRGIPMKDLIGESCGEEQRTEGARRNVPRHDLRALTVATVATAIVGAGILCGTWRLALAGDESRGVSSAAPVPHLRVIRELRRTLKEQDDRLIILGMRVLDERDSLQSLKDQILDARVRVQGAETNYRNAKLAREIAEIALTEYTEGIFVQDLATVEGEIRLAESGVKRSQDHVEEAKKRRDEIMRVANPKSASDLVALYNFSDRVLVAMLEVDRSKLVLEQAQSKKAVLVRYTKAKRVTELGAEVAKDRSEELAKQATWDLERAKLDRLQKAVTQPSPASDIARRLLALLDRAMPIEEQVHTKLDQLATATDSGEKLQNELRELTNELGAILEEAEAARAASEFAGLKSRLRRAIGR
jgi:hypothetical protein